MAAGDIATSREVYVAFAFAAADLLVEVDEDGAYGRSWADSPEVDGCVYINHETDAQPGDVVMVEVENAEDFDLWGRIVATAPERKRRF